ncbi:MAG: PKD domain-containing protein [Bacteroidetes bacterium]|nr:PKD domain-containing protein [Bacteroidota bacterium]
MKTSTLLKFLIPGVLFLGIVTQWREAFTYGNSKPPAGYTMASGEGNCTSCHSGSVKTNSSSITFVNKGASSYYDPGVADTFTLTGTVSGIKVWGFEVTVLDSATKKYIGTLGTVTSGTSIISTTISGGKREYVVHDKKVSGSGTYSWDIEWTPPSSYSGTAIFYTTINAANGDGADTKDLIHVKNFKYKKRPSGVAPLCGFKVSPSSMLACVGDTVTLTDTSLNSPTNYKWTIQNGTPSTASTKIVKTVFSKAGTDTISLVSSNANGTSAPVKKIITVLASPYDSLTAAGGKINFCVGDSVMITAAYGSKYKWSTGETTRSIYAKTSNNYSCIVSNAAGCSRQSVTIKITVSPLPTVSLTSTKDSICLGGSVTFNATTGHSNYEFFNGSTSVQNGTSSSYTPTALTAGNSITVVATNSGSCASKPSNAITVKIMAAPIVALTHGKGSNTYCKGETVTLTATAGHSNYDFLQNSKNIYSGTKNIYSFNANTLGTNDIISTLVTGTNGCTNIASIKLSYAAPINIGFSTTINKTSVTFDDTTNSTSRAWDFGDGGSDTKKTATHTFANNKKFKVTLTTKNAGGCTDTLSKFFSFTAIGEDIVHSGNISVYPNPAYNRIIIQTNNVKNERAELVLMDMKGAIALRQSVEFFNGENKIELPLDNLNSGVYILQIITSETVNTIRVSKSGN